MIWSPWNDSGPYPLRASFASWRVHFIGHETYQCKVDRLLWVSGLHVHVKSTELNTVQVFIKQTQQVITNPTWPIQTHSLILLAHPMKTLCICYYILKYCVFVSDIKRRIKPKNVSYCQHTNVPSNKLNKPMNSIFLSNGLQNRRNPPPKM